MKHLYIIFIILFSNLILLGQQKELVVNQGHTLRVMAIDYSPDGKYLASGSKDKTVKIWNTVSGKLVRTLFGHTDILYTVKYSPDGKYLAAASRDNTIKIWNVTSGELIHTFVRSSYIFRISYSPDGKF